MATTIISFRWLDLLEKEFDKNFVDVDQIIDEFEDPEEHDWAHVAKAKLEALSSCFAQLTHKAQTIFQTNAKLEAELVNLRHELTQSQATCAVLKEESHDMLMKLHSAHLELYTKGSSTDPASSQVVDQIRKRLEKELEEERNSRLETEVPQQEISLLQKENDGLRKQIVTLQSELCGAKLASKYLDKELAGRIQQIQLLSHGDLKGDQHTKLWHQLEAEIHLHRHKTIVRAFRNRSISSQNEVVSANATCKPERQRTPLHRYITVNCSPQQDFGLSITGGKDYGIPIMISYIHPNSPAKASGQFYIGDAILSVNSHSLKEVNHSDAVRILSSQKGKMTLEVLFVPPEEEEDEDEEGSLADENFALKYRMFDEEVSSLASSSAFLQNGRLSRASIDSIRGSTDDILASPRKYSEINAEFSDEVNGVSQGDGTPIDDIPSSIFQDLPINEAKDEAQREVVEPTIDNPKDTSQSPSTKTVLEASPTSQSQKEEHQISEKVSSTLESQAVADEQQEHAQMQQQTNKDEVNSPQSPHKEETDQNQEDSGGKSLMAEYPSTNLSKCVPIIGRRVTNTSEQELFNGNY